MIFLQNNNESFRIKTTSIADIDYQVNYVDIDPFVSAVPGSAQGKITTIGTTIICPAPATGISRQLKSIFIRNKNLTTSNLISVLKDVSGIEYLGTGEVLLIPGATMFYESGIGWSLGTILSSVLETLNISKYQDFDGIADPAAPSVNGVRIYSKNVAGRMLPKWKGPTGADTPFQAALFKNNVVMWNPGATSGYMIGSLVTAIVAGVSVLPSTTNRYTSLRKNTFTAATGVNTMNSLRGEPIFYRGAIPTSGGFFFFCRAGFNTWTPTNRLFVGMCVDTTALLTADPSTKFNMLGFAVDTADTAISFMHNDGVGVAIKETIAVQPALATNNVYDFFIYCKPNDSVVYYRIDDLSSNVTLIDSSITLDLPTTTALLIPTCAIGPGATNAGATAASVGVNRMYIESDY
jgi:hypothetical protein